MRKKLLFNTIFYAICFFLLAGTIYRLGITIPPERSSPMYRDYTNGLICVSILVALMAVIPWFVMELDD